MNKESNQTTQTQEQPQAVSQETKEVSNVSSPRDLLDKTLSIMSLEINKLITESKGCDKPLDASKIRSLTDMAKTLVVVDKNYKESPVSNNLEQLSDEELLEMAKTVISESQPKKEQA